MGTYYGYTNRDQDKSVIDWAGITKTISEDIFKEKNSREARRFELDKTQNEQLRKLDEYTQGIDKSANQAAMEAAQGYRDFLMENHKLMKDGLMSVNDSKLVKSNAKATWATLNTAFKGHQDAYKAKVEAGGEGNMLLAEKMSEMFDFQNKKIIPSKNGEAVFVNIDPKTGKIDMDTAMPVSSLLNNQLQMWDTIDVQESASDAASRAAVFIKSPSSTRTIQDARQNPEFVSWKENTTKAALDTPRRIASVLMDYLNIDSDDIKMVEDSKGVMQPELTDEQIKMAEDAYGTALEIGLGYSDAKDYIAPDPGRFERRSKIKDKETKYNTIIAALQGDEAKFKTIFDGASGAQNVRIGSGGLSINGNNSIAVGSDQSISQAGARIAAQQGLDANDFVVYLKKKNLQNGMVSSNVSSFGAYDTRRSVNYVTSSNIEKLNKSLTFDTSLGDVDRADPVGRRNSFRRTLESIASPGGVNVEVKDDDTVVVNGVSIPDGVNNPSRVLKQVQKNTKPELPK